jgi:hypothetical protein
MFQQPRSRTRRLRRRRLACRSPLSSTSYFPMHRRTVAYPSSLLPTYLWCLRQNDKTLYHTSTALRHSIFLPSHTPPLLRCRPALTATIPKGKTTRELFQNGMTSPGSAPPKHRVTPGDSGAKRSTVPGRDGTGQAGLRGLDWTGLGLDFPPVALFDTARARLVRSMHADALPCGFFFCAVWGGRIGGVSFHYMLHSEVSR